MQISCYKEYESNEMQINYYQENKMKCESILLKKMKMINKNITNALKMALDTVYKGAPSNHY